MTPNLGQLIADPALAIREAVHIAVTPVVAGEKLQPGDKVRVLKSENGAYTVGRAEYRSVSVGVVDPFLLEPVQEGQRFWIMLNPNSVRNVRHHWEHPEFPEASPSRVANDPVTAKMWIAMFARQILQSDPCCPGEGYDRLEYSNLIKAANQYVSTGEKTELWSASFMEVRKEEWGQFWSQYHTVTGHPIRDLEPPFTYNDSWYS